MLEYDFEDSVGYWVGMTSHVMRRAMNAQLARENITLRQWEVLAWIALCGEMSQVELSDRLGIEAPTLAGVLARMERDGWLERTACTEDRRRKRLRPTPKSEQVWARMVECCHRVRAQAIQGIPAEELQALRTTCEKIRANLGAVADAPCGCDEALEQPTGQSSAVKMSQ